MPLQSTLRLSDSKKSLGGHFFLDNIQYAYAKNLVFKKVSVNIVVEEVLIGQFKDVCGGKKVTYT